MPARPEAVNQRPSIQELPRLESNPLDPDRVILRVQEILALGETRREDLKAILFDESMKEEGVEGLQALLTKHGFSGKMKVTRESEEDLLEEIEADDTISLYLKEMSQTSLFSRQQEVVLAALIWLEKNIPPEDKPVLRRRVRPKAEAAKKWLIEANTRLVISVAKKYRGWGVPFLDLIQEGNLGLMRAAEKFDWSRGWKFSTYASWWIWQAVGRALKTDRRTVSMPFYKVEETLMLHRVADDLEQDIGRPPTPEEIAEVTGVEVKEVKLLLQASKEPVSLERPVGEEGKDSELGDLIEEESTTSFSEIAEQALLAERLEEILDTLTSQEAEILRWRYGLQDGRCYNPEEMGKTWFIDKKGQAN